MVRPPTDPDGERRVLQLLEQALELEGERRTRFLERRCGADADLRARLEHLLELERRGALAPAQPQARLGPRSGDRVGAYRLVERLGAGGMGDVWRARRDDGSFEREVAVKFLLQAPLRADLVQRFERERALLADLRHPNLATLLDGGDLDGVPYLVMELVEGRSLIEHADQLGLDVTARVELLTQVARAVAHLHAAGVVHRDLKPGNVLVEPDGRAVVLDLGIAKRLDDAAGADVTRPSERILTPRYASPEQRAGAQAAPRADVWALGVVLCELVLGRHPFESEDDGAAPRRARLPGDLEAIAHCALHPDPERSYETAAQLAEDLQRFVEGLPVRARGDSWGYRASSFARRRRAPLALVGVAAVAGLALVWGASGARRALSRERELQGRLVAHLEASLDLDHPELVGGRLRRSGREETLLQLEREIAELAQRYPDTPGLEGRLRARAARALWSLGRPDAAREQLDQALRGLQASGAGNATELARARVLDADLTRVGGNPELALAGLDGLLAALPEGAVEERRGLELAARWSRCMSLRALDRWREARDGFVELRPELALHHGADSPQVYALDLHLARLAADLGRPAEAEAAARDARAGLLATLGPAHPLSAQAQLDLAGLLSSALRLSEARTQLDPALAVLREWLVPEDPLLARAAYEQARLLHLEGDLGGARAYYEQAQQGFDRALGEGSRPALAARVLEAQLCAAAGDTASASTILAAVQLEIDGRPDLHETATWFNARHAEANLLTQLGRWSEAEQVFADFVDARDRVQGPGHYQSLAAHDGLAQCLVAQGRNTDAIAELRGVLARAEAAGLEGPWTLSWRGRLAYALWLAGERSECCAILGELLEDYERSVGHQRRQEYTVALDLAAECALRDGEAERALELYDRGLTLRTATGAQGRWDTLLAVLARARVLSTLGRHAQAERALRELVSEPLPPQLSEEDRLDWRLAWAESIVLAEDVEDALPRLEEAAQELEHARGLDSDEALWCRGLLGVQLAREGRLEDAVWLLEEAQARFIEGAGAAHARTRLLTEELARTQRLRGDEAAALELESSLR